MTRHQKRLSVPNSWPVARKEGTFTVKADAGPHGEAGVPLVILLRDVLGYVDSTKEARYALEQDSVLVNGEPISDEKRPIGMFDILAFAEREEYYRVFPDEGGRLALSPIDAESAGSKLGKVVEKTQVPGGDVQLTLHDGETLVTDRAIATNDSVVVSNDDGEIVAHFEYEEDALVTAVQGSHAGEIGRIRSIGVTPGSASNNVVVESDGDAFETVEEYVVVIDENFVEGEDDEPEDATEEAAAEVEAGTAEETEPEPEPEPESEPDAGDASDDDADEDGEVSDDE
ncbi:MAG: 30S ribosomal protein S4e [Haloarculaceae archaeon]